MLHKCAQEPWGFFSLHWVRHCKKQHNFKGPFQVQVVSMHPGLSQAFTQPFRHQIHLAKCTDDCRLSYIAAGYLGNGTEVTPQWKSSNRSKCCKAGYSWRGQDSQASREIYRCVCVYRVCTVLGSKVEEFQTNCIPLKQKLQVNNK